MVTVITMKIAIANDFNITHHPTISASIHHHIWSDGDALGNSEVDD